MNTIKKFREPFARRDEAFEVREFEVAVRVDEARHEDAVIIRCVGGLGGQLADFQNFACGVVVGDSSVFDWLASVGEYVLGSDSLGHSHFDSVFVCANVNIRYVICKYIF